MNESQWYATDDPLPMCFLILDRASPREIRLCACACCRRIWHLLVDATSRHAVEVAEQFADGLIPEWVRARAEAQALAVSDRFPADTWSLTDAVAPDSAGWARTFAAAGSSI